MTEPKPVVLPLHHHPIMRFAAAKLRKVESKTKEIFLFFADTE
jgi:hypothetical protein